MTPPSSSTSAACPTRSSSGASARSTRSSRRSGRSRSAAPGDRHRRRVRRRARAAHRDVPDALAARAETRRLADADRRCPADGGQSPLGGRAGWPVRSPPRRTASRRSAARRWPRHGRSTPRTRPPAPRSPRTAVPARGRAPDPYPLQHRPARDRRRRDRARHRVRAACRRAPRRGHRDRGPAAPPGRPPDGLGAGRGGHSRPARRRRRGRCSDGDRAGRRRHRRLRPGGRERGHRQQDRHLRAGGARPPPRHPVPRGRAAEHVRPSLPDGASIVVEERDGDEVRALGGRRVAPEATASGTRPSTSPRPGSSRRSSPTRACSSRRSGPRSRPARCGR